MVCTRLRARDGELLDEAIVLVLDASRVELHLHGAPALVRRVLDELGPRDARPARTLEERAEQRLSEAASEAAARMLLDQTRGALRRELEALLCEEPARAAHRLAELVRRGRVARALVRPPVVVLAGPVNAGKSTLFNVLVGEARALVHPEAGTTRDAVRARVRLGAYAVDLHDTAGERPLDPRAADDASEREGQELAAELTRTADLVLELVPTGATPRNVAGARLPLRRELRSRADLLGAGAQDERRPALSALHAPAQARDVVQRVFLEALALPDEPWDPGAGVPFEAEWMDGLAAGLEGMPLHALKELVRSWCAGG
jgi:tRNA U34 5-carboxymethylaminomethyl modifying GTPase MnmE/TrmE